MAEFCSESVASCSPKKYRLVAGLPGLGISERYFIEPQLITLQIAEALGDETGLVKKVADTGLKALQLVVKSAYHQGKLLVVNGLQCESFRTPESGR